MIQDRQVHQIGQQPSDKKGQEHTAEAFEHQANNKYAVVEDTVVNINGTKTNLAKNVQLLKSANGGVYGATVNGTAITIDAATVAQLVSAGILVKL